MKLRVREFAELTGVSVRTLHHYHHIGLLEPAAVDPDSGYRYYDERSLGRMQQILFYRELDFPLKTIHRILSSPDYDQEKVLEEQKQLLILKKRHLERLICAVEDAMKGENVMNAFQNEEYSRYREEVQARWGNTQAYAEFAQRERDGETGAADGMQRCMAAFAQVMAQGHAPESEEAQKKVEQLRSYITANFYTCTVPILASLGQMYVADDRFRENIDRNGTGTADYISRAIAFYCR